MLIYMYMYMDIHVEHPVGYLMSLFGLMAIAENMNNQNVLRDMAMINL